MALPFGNFSLDPFVVINHNRKYMDFLSSVNPSSDLLGSSGPPKLHLVTLN